MLRLSSRTKHTQYPFTSLYLSLSLSLFFFFFFFLLLPPSDSHSDCEKKNNKKTTPTFTISCLYSLRTLLLTVQIQFSLAHCPHHISLCDPMKCFTKSPLFSFFSQDIKFSSRACKRHMKRLIHKERERERERDKDESIRILVQ